MINDAPSTQPWRILWVSSHELKIHVRLIPNGQHVGNCPSEAAVRSRGDSLLPGILEDEPWEVLLFGSRLVSLTQYS